MLTVLPGLLPFIDFTLFFIFFSTANAGRCRCPRRTAFLYAAVAIAAVVFISDEFSSALRLITRTSIAAVWTVVCILTAPAILLQRPRWKSVLFKVPRLDRFEALSLGVLAAIFIIEAVIGLASPPNTWDSMTYHMGRIMHWIQNRGIAYYPTNCLRQLYLAPGAEMATMQLTLLAKSDRLVNLVQLFSMAGSTIGVSLITREFGGARRAQLFAAIFAATIPMAILQSTGTQNDLAESFWIVCFALFMLRLRTTAGVWTNAITAGAALGFSLLTKGTSLFFVPPLFVALGVMVFLQKPVRLRSGPPRALSLICVGSIAALIIAPHALQLRSLAGSSLGSTFNPTQTGNIDFNVANERLTPGIVAANIVRNIGLHLGTPSKKINKLLERLIYSGLEKEVDNPGSTWINSHFHVRPSLNEDGAGNPLHLFAIAVAFSLLFFIKRGVRLRPLPFFAGAILTAFLLFCLLLKWQPFHSRLHLPLFFLAAPVVALIFSNCFSRKAGPLLISLFLLCALPWVLFNMGRPLLGNKSVFVVPRIDQYFVNRPDLEAPYLQAAAFVHDRKPRTIGLDFSEDDWEYPLWVLLKNRAEDGPEIEHVLVDNPSRRFQKHPFTPDLILSTKNRGSATIDGVMYVTIRDFGKIEVLERK